MLHKSLAIVCLCTGLSAMAAAPVAAQVKRSIESYSIAVDEDGNTIESKSFYNYQIVDPYEELQNRRKVFFSKYVGFTAREAERFWPAYNEYDRKRDSIITRQRKILAQFTSDQTVSAVSDIEVKALLDSYMLCIEKDSQMQMEYYKKFLTILSAKKVAKVYQAEIIFTQMLLNEIKGGR